MTVVAGVGEIRQARSMKLPIHVLLVVGLIPTVCAFAPVAASAQGAERNDLPVSSAGYLGGAGDDQVGAVAVAVDGTLLFAGALPGHSPGGVTAAPVLGGGDGVILRLSADGRTALSLSRIGSMVADMESAADGSVVIAARGQGMVRLASDLQTVVWTDGRPAGEPERVAVGGVGAEFRAAVLTSSKTVRVLDPSGSLQGSRTFTDSSVSDVAVSADGRQVVVTGFNNRSINGTPVQVPFIRAFNPTFGAPLWTAYDWTAGQLVTEQSNSLADSRGVRVAFGLDGMLYFAGRTDGGNNTFRFDPLIVDRQLPGDELISYDPYTNTAGIGGASAITVFGRFDPVNGDVLKLQLLLARLSNGNGNTVVPGAITADRQGRVFLGGQTFATIQNRDQQTLSGLPVGPYQGGEAFLLAVEPDFTAREAWTVFTAPGGTQSSSTEGVAVAGDQVVWAAELRNDTAQMLIVDALQPDRDAEDSVYLATRRWTLFADGFESGDLGAWSSP